MKDSLFLWFSIVIDSKERSNLKKNNYISGRSNNYMNRYDWLTRIMYCQALRCNLFYVPHCSSRLSFLEKNVTSAYPALSAC